VVGQPKRYAIYGPQTLPNGNQRAPGDAANSASGWRGSLAIGRDWRCFANLQELPGRGVIVMKFVRSQNNTVTAGAAFTPRLG
jgi:hypothetical protein